MRQQYESYFPLPGQFFTVNCLRQPSLSPFHAGTLYEKATIDRPRLYLFLIKYHILTLKSIVKLNYSVISANRALTSFAKTDGGNSTCAPILPALKTMLSIFCALSSIKVLYSFFMPIGEQPPLM